MAKPKAPKPAKAAESKIRNVDAIKHTDASRKNIPTVEYQSVMQKPDQEPAKVSYPRAYSERNRDLDPQLMWRGKDEQDWSDLVVHAPPLYIQEKIHPKVLILHLPAQPLPLREARHHLQRVA